MSWVKVGLVTRISRSSPRSRDEGGSACSFDDGRPNLPNDKPILDLSRFFLLLVPLLSKVLLLLLKVSSALNVSSTTLVLDLFIKSSANDTFGLGSRRTDVREVIDERSCVEFCLDRDMWFDWTSRLELMGGLMPDGTIGSLKLSRVGLG